MRAGETALRHGPGPDRGRDWRDDAACVGVDPELFFSITDHGVQAAKTICGDCPVQAACRQWADGEGITYGVWGGESEEERRERLAGRDRPAPPAPPILVCANESCRRGFVARRRNHGQLQRYCSPYCHHRAMAKQRGEDCGSPAAARRHRKRGEPLDDACRVAESLYRAQLRTRHASGQFAEAGGA